MGASMIIDRDARYEAGVRAAYKRGYAAAETAFNAWLVAGLAECDRLRATERWMRRALENTEKALNAQAETIEIEVAEQDALILRCAETEAIANAALAMGLSELNAVREDVEWLKKTLGYPTRA